MKHKRWLLLVGTAILASLVLSACGGGAAPAESTAEEIVVQEGDPVRVGVATVTSGAGVDVLGLDELRAAEIAAGDFGDVLGFEVEIVAEDTLCSAEGGQTAATKLAADPSIAAVVGHTCSSSCTPASEIYDQAGMTMVSPSCTAPTLTADDTHVASFLRTAFNDNFQAPVAAEFAYNELGATKAATIHDGSPYAEQLQQLFAEKFAELGGEVVAQEAVNVGDTDMRPVLTTIAALEPDIIYAPIFPAEGGFLAVQRNEVAGLEDTYFMGADGLYASTYLEAAGDAAEGTFASGPGSGSGPEYDAFLAEYLDAYGEEPPAPFHLQAYDATTMILMAVAEVGTVDNKGALHIDRQALRDALYATDFEGMSGPVTCAASGDCGPTNLAVVEVKDGTFEQVYP